MRALSRILTIVAMLALVRLALPKFRNNVTTSNAGASMKSTLRNVLALWDSLNRAHQPLDSVALVAAGFHAVEPGIFSQADIGGGVRLRILPTF